MVEPPAEAQAAAAALGFWARVGLLLRDPEVGGPLICSAFSWRQRCLHSVFRRVTPWASAISANTRGLARGWQTLLIFATPCHFLALPVLQVSCFFLLCLLLGFGHGVLGSFLFMYIADLGERSLAS